MPFFGENLWRPGGVGLRGRRWMDTTDAPHRKDKAAHGAPTTGIAQPNFPHHGLTDRELRRPVVLSCLNKVPAGRRGES
jgi:hypothetical protein